MSIWFSKNSSFWHIMMPLWCLVPSEVGYLHFRNAAWIPESLNSGQSQTHTQGVDHRCRGVPKVLLSQPHESRRPRLGVLGLTLDDDSVWQTSRGCSL